MAELKTRRNKQSVSKFINAVEHEGRRADARKILALLKEITGARPEMWGDSIVGFGSYHYKYASGREGDWMKIGIANNKQYISLYSCAGDETGYVAERYRDRLPKANIGKSCVRFKRLSDLDEDVLRELIRETADS